jgi:group I intron endonuclease
MGDNFYIYKIMNKLNNKIYIGKRKTKKDIKNDDYLGSGVVIKRSIEKNGKDNFVKEIIDICESNDELSEKEKYWISYYNSTDNKIGYNIAMGGGGGDTYSKNPNLNIIREKFRGNKNPMFGRSFYDVWLGKYGKEEADRKMTEKGNKHKKHVVWNKGKIGVYSEETLNKMKNSKLRNDINYNDIKKLIDENKNITEVCKILNISRSLYYKLANTNGRKSFINKIDYDEVDLLLKDGKTVQEVCKILNISRRSCYDYLKKNGDKYNTMNRYKKQNNGIKMFNLNNELIDTFNVNEIKDKGFYISSIYKCCDNKLKSTQGFRWKWL